MMLNTSNLDPKSFNLAGVQDFSVRACFKREKKRVRLLRFFTPLYARKSQLYGRARFANLCAKRGKCLRKSECTPREKLDQIVKQFWGVGLGEFITVHEIV